MHKKIASFKSSFFPYMSGGNVKKVSLLPDIK